MKKLIIIFTGILFTTLGFSQGDAAWYQLNNRNIDLQEKWESFGISEIQFNAIKDEAYANPKFINGNIYQDDDLMKKNIPMRYNAFSDEIEIQNGPSENDYGALRKDPSIYVKILPNDLYIFIPYKGSNEKGGYFNIIADGNTYDLYKKTKATFHEPQPAKTSYDRDTPPYFSKDVTYYLVKNGQFYELPTRKSKILKVMDEKKKEVKAYVKQNNLDLDKEADLSKLVLYFDSLL